MQGCVAVLLALFVGGGSVKSIVDGCMVDPENQTKELILLVDDDNFLLDVYGRKFIKNGYQVQLNYSVDDALKVLREGCDPRVVLFDITMPGHDGFYFLEKLKDEKLCQKALKVALTNQSSDTDKQKASELGADLFLVKASFIPSEVVETIRNELAKRA